MWVSERARSSLTHIYAVAQPSSVYLCEWGLASGGRVRACVEACVWVRVC
jgi:hypothetical protein